jgi:type IX secretion system substrate protein
MKKILIILFCLIFIKESNTQPLYNICKHGINKPITDFNTVYDTIIAPFTPYALTYLCIDLDSILHTWVSDLTIKIYKSSTIVILIENCGGSNDNIINANFVDTAVRFVCNVPPPFTGYDKPIESLTPFYSTIPTGPWILIITDNAGGDTGVLKSWCLKYYATESGINKISNEIPSEFSLSQNYPNPFNPTTKIKFSIPLDSSFRGNNNVLLKVYDALGREVQTLVNEPLQPGTYEVDFDGSNYSSGAYYYKLISGDFIETKKMIILK